MENQDMAFKLPSDSGYIDVALRIDDALDMSKELYDAYIENPSHDNLIIKEGMQPTFIRMRKILPWGAAKKIEDAKLDMRNERDGDKISREMKPCISWMYEEVRVAMTNIINPPDCAEPIEFEKDSEIGASFGLAAKLLELGVMTDLWNARRNAIKNNTPEETKKK
jgi:hypothetical protein